MQKLTPKQERFVEEYLIDLNATQAAIRAGYSPKTAEVLGSRLVKKSLVAKAIELAKRERAARSKIDAEFVLQRLAEIASADKTEIYDKNGKVLNPKKWPVHLRRMLKGIKTTGYEFVDQLKALELLGRHIKVGAFEERISSTSEVTINVKYGNNRGSK